MVTMIRRNSLNFVSSKWWNAGSSSSGRSPSFGSSVAVQKLRESKWFDSAEERIFCAVIEVGFVVELRHPETGESWFGVTAIETKKSMKPTAENIKIFSVKLSDSNRRLKIYNTSLDQLWKQGYRIRINNLYDKSKKAHSEKDILAQVKYATKTKMPFHNSQHFAEFCRYGDRPQDNRKRQISDCAKWGGTNMGATIIYFAMQTRNTKSDSK
ncbi:uncharacterized protein LOC129774831 isoform X1 [Toxorhynchites rutilus septentrionalis]|uniref:uncharacterized protein LOC129774831 isoform X1 n=1 Tax=Toxorhynchites rutilus septentrionalis TaxID=329112 RepID=UPI00247AE591|nr:uncharacterized protein LOC129774831 isoform X1 [Toxorhynchites rutilus septentrionalis]